MNPITLAITAVRVALIIAINAVPIWGFTGEGWSPATILALYWLQIVVSIPLISVLIVLHRRMTHKLGHYNVPTATSVNHGPVVYSRSSYLSSFLMVSLGFALAHGIFLAAVLGLFWRKAAGGVDLEDLRVGLTAMLNFMAVSFAVDLVYLRRRPFAWIRNRSETLMQRVMVTHFAILLGMAVALFSEHDFQGFFRVFLILKLLVDLSGELPQWNPKEPPQWVVRFLNKLGDGKGDVVEDWHRMSAEERARYEDDERVVDPDQLKAP